MRYVPVAYIGVNKVYPAAVSAFMEITPTVRVCAGEDREASMIKVTASGKENRRYVKYSDEK